MFCANQRRLTMFQTGATSSWWQNSIGPKVKDPKSSGWKIATGNNDNNHLLQHFKMSDTFGGPDDISEDHNQIQLDSNIRSAEATPPPVCLSLCADGARLF